MLDDHSRDVYRSTKLERDLREEIQVHHKRRHQVPTMEWLKPAAGLACVALIAGIWIFRQPDITGISLNGESIGREAAILTMQSVEYTGGIMRLAVDPDAETPLQTAEECIALDIETEEEVFITISGGVLLLPNVDNIPTFAGQSGPALPGSTVHISLSGCEATAPIQVLLHSHSGETLCSYSVTYDEVTHVWSIAADIRE